MTLSILLTLDSIQNYYAMLEKGNITKGLKVTTFAKSGDTNLQIIL